MVNYSGFYRAFGKRSLDVAVAAAALLALGPPLLLLMAAIRLDGHGPALFVQTRIGRHQRRFRILKLRTMARGRPTSLGRWLRHTGIDELPQLVNVLAGEMSVVGPRPLRPRDCRDYRAANSPRFAVRPGITGLAQLAGRDLDPAARELWDRRYVAAIAPGLDAGIALRTVLVLGGVALPAAAVAPPAAFPATEKTAEA